MAIKLVAVCFLTSPICVLIGWVLVVIGVDQNFRGAP